MLLFSSTLSLESERPKISLIRMHERKAWVKVSDSGYYEDTKLHGEGIGIQLVNRTLYEVSLFKNNGGFHRSCDQKLQLQCGTTNF